MSNSFIQIGELTNIRMYYYFHDYFAFGVISIVELFRRAFLGTIRQINHCILCKKTLLYENILKSFLPIREANILKVIAFH